MNRFFLLLLTGATVFAADLPTPARLQRVTARAPSGSAVAVRVAEGPLVMTAKIFPPDGSSDANRQADALLTALGEVLAKAGSGLDQLIRLNVYVTEDRVTPAVDRVLAARCGAAPPAVTVVRSALERAGAVVAVDAVAATDRATEGVELIEPRVAILPAGPKVFIAGQAKRGKDLAESVAQTMDALQRSLAHLGLELGDVAHVKAFVTPLTEHAVIMREIGRSFAGKPVPPVVLTEWISTTPAEIELVVSGRKLAPPKESVAYLPLPDMTTSPYYSRVTVATGPLIFFSAIYSGEGGGDPREQWKRVFAQLGGTLLDAGSSFRHLVKATYYLTDASAREAMGEIRGVYYDPSRPPSASAADVKGLGRPGSVLLDMIAVPARAETSAKK